MIIFWVLDNISDMLRVQLFNSTRDIQWLNFTSVEHMFEYEYDSTNKLIGSITIGAILVVNLPLITYIFCKGAGTFMNKLIALDCLICIRLISRNIYGRIKYGLLEYCNPDLQTFLLLFWLICFLMFWKSWYFHFLLNYLSKLSLMESVIWIFLIAMWYQPLITQYGKRNGLQEFASFPLDFSSIVSTDFCLSPLSSIATSLLFEDLGCKLKSREIFLGLWSFLLSLLSQEHFLASVSFIKIITITFLVRLTKFFRNSLSFNIFIPPQSFKDKSVLYSYIISSNSISTYYHF